MEDFMICNSVIERENWENLLFHWREWNILQNVLATLSVIECDKRKKALIYGGL